MSIRRYSVRSLMGVGALVCSLCGCDSGPCNKGDTRRCLGAGHCPGAQICSTDGSNWGQCECGSTGGTSSTASSSAGGATAGGNRSTGGAAYLCGDVVSPVPAGHLSVSATGDVSAAGLTGFVESQTWGANIDTQSPCIRVVFGSSALCASGFVDADPTYNSGASLYIFRLSDGAATDASVNSVVVQNGVSVAIQYVGDEAGNSGVYLNILDTNGISYCLGSAAWSSNTLMPIDSFNTRCWDNSGIYAKAGTAIFAIVLSVGASDSIPYPFAFCVTDFAIK